MWPEMNVKVLRTKDAIYSCALTFCSAHFLCALAYGPHAKNMALLATTTIYHLVPTHNTPQYVSLSILLFFLLLHASATLN